DAGHEVHALIMSDGAVGGDPTARPGEAYAGAAFLRLTDCEVLGLPDTELASHDCTMVQAIEAKIVSLNPDLIFTHSSNDQHQDHEAVHWATMRAGRRHPAILCYESPSVTRAFSPQVFVDIADYVDAKASAVAAHHDQADKPYMNAQSLAGTATFRGAQGKLPMAEGFEAVRINGFAGVL
ncbi:PIG-L deacetylase family protein, partial [Tessaracoccus lubricantis]